VNKGADLTGTFVVNCPGGTRNIHFEEYSEPTPWFKINALTSDSSSGTFPLEVEVVADTEKLRPGQKYTGWIEVNTDSAKAKVNLSLKLESLSKTVPPLQPFRFRSGDVARVPEELVPLCDRYWAEAREYLYNDLFFKRWFIELRRNDMVARLEDCRLEKNKDVGLDRFLRSFDPNLDYPSVTISSSNTHLGNYDFSARDRPEATVHIHNQGRGCCYGTLEVKDATWLSVPYREFAVAPGQDLDIRLQVNSYELIWEREHTAQIIIANNSQNVVCVNNSDTTRARI
jgi:hypothetical protein